MQPQPAQVDQVRPERRQRLLGRLQEGARLAPGVGLQQKRSGGLGQRLVILGDRDRHACTLSIWGPPCLPPVPAVGRVEELSWTMRSCAQGIGPKFHDHGARRPGTVSGLMSAREHSCHAGRYLIGSMRTPGFSTPLGSRAFLAAVRATAKGSGRSMSYQGRCSRPTA